MRVEMLKSKIHRAVVTGRSVHYEGSITIDKELMKAAGIYQNEKVHVFDINNGNRLETYVIEGEKGEIVLNGAAARLVKKGDLVIIVAFGFVDEKQARKVNPKVINVDSNNRVIKKRGKKK